MRDLIFYNQTNDPKIENFFSIDQINPKLKLLHERFEEIQKEFLSKKDQLILMNFGGEVGYYMKDDIAYKGWKVAPLYGNIEDIHQVNGSLDRFNGLTKIENNLLKIKPNVQLLPKLTETLLESGIVKRVGISVVYPGKEISWHIDQDPERRGLGIIRGLFGLDIVEEENKESFIYLKKSSNEIEKRVFKNNEFVFFWGRVRHKVENNLSQPRYMICFDTEVPYNHLIGD
jgi:hypothetical protein